MSLDGTHIQGPPVLDYLHTVSVLWPWLYTDKDLPHPFSIVVLIVFNHCFNFLTTATHIWQITYQNCVRLFSFSLPRSISDYRVCFFKGDQRHFHKIYVSNCTVCLSYIEMYMYISTLTMYCTMNKENARPIFVYVKFWLLFSMNSKSIMSSTLHIILLYLNMIFPFSKDLYTVYHT